MSPPFYNVRYKPVHCQISATNLESRSCPRMNVNLGGGNALMPQQSPNIQ